MSSSPAPSSRPARAALLALSLTLALPELGCNRDDPAQIQVVQMLAEVMDKRTPNRKGSACLLAVPERQDPMSCDNLIVPILHYAPGFPGSRVTRRAPTSGGFFDRPIKVHVHYEGKEGKGNLDVTMRRSGKTGPWHIYSVFPAP